MSKKKEIKKVCFNCFFGRVSDKHPVETVLCMRDGEEMKPTDSCGSHTLDLEFEEDLNRLEHKENSADEGKGVQYT